MRANMIFKKLLEENTGVHLHNHRSGKVLVVTSKPQISTKRKCRYIGLHQIKNFYASNDNTKKAKRQCTEWEKIFAHPILIRIYYLEYMKSSYNSTIKSEITQFRAMNLNRHFSEDNTEVDNKSMKTSSISQIIREIQIKTTMKYNFTPTKMVKT